MAGLSRNTVHCILTFQVCLSSPAPHPTFHARYEATVFQALQSCCLSKTFCSTSVILLPTPLPTQRKALGGSKMLTASLAFPTALGSSCSTCYSFARPCKCTLSLYLCTLGAVLVLARFTYTHVSAFNIWVQVVGVNIKRN